MNRFVQFAIAVLLIAGAARLVLDKIAMISTLPEGTLRDGIDTISREVGPPVRDLLSAVITLIIFLALVGIGLKWLNKKSG